LRAETVLSLAVTAASEHRVQDVLDVIVRGLAAQPGIAQARVWLLRPGDICEECFSRPQCNDQTQCLHLLASAGSSIASPGEDWNEIQKEFWRIPRANGMEGRIVQSGKAILIEDLQSETPGFVQPDWARSEALRSFAGYPLVSHEKVLGVLAIFSREPIGKQDFEWLRLFANQAAVAITNAEAFEELQRAQTRQEEHARELQQVIDVAPLHMFIWEADGSASYPNRAASEYFGPIPPKAPMVFLDMVTHPEDVEQLKEGIEGALRQGEAFQTEARMRRHDGQYRWFVYQIVPLRDEQNKIVRWCGTRVDIDVQKRAQESVQRENLVLREEVDKVSMFEEIVGTSAALQAVLGRVTKVAKSDSTVLVYGETGTGKELIARAIHKRSPRAHKAFVSVNCAAIPRDLIASELFGHERGAFTGALQRRLGRFEVAEGGTLFLDEIGEIPAETQVALLRVLQEREFQRVGGNQSIRTDVRVIAATHRNLPAAIEAGTFRSDLYYRINVFPIDVPPLRERREDIPLLVEYFIDRYTSKAGKKITSIEKKSMRHLQSYAWPGNIRELQNVIERSVIVCVFRGRELALAATGSGAGAAR
jgi:PAS domain S-box-containing protein